MHNRGVQDMGIRDLAWVPRWSIIRTNRTQSVAEHSYFVAIYAGQVADAIKWRGNRGQLVTRALLHDLDEIVSGDIPGPAKRAMEYYSNPYSKADYHKWLEQMTADRAGPTPSVDAEWYEDIKKIIKVADYLEAALFLWDEFNSGNLHAAPYISYNEGYLDNAIRALEEAGHSVGELQAWVTTSLAEQRRLHRAAGLAREPVRWTTPGN